MSYQPPPGDDNLAYGDDYSESRGHGSQPGQTGDRGFIGSTFNKLKTRYDQHQQSSAQNYGYSSDSNQGNYGQQASNTGYPQPGQAGYQGGAPTQRPQQKRDLATGVFGALHGTIQTIGSDVGRLLGTEYRPPGQQPGPGPAPGYSGPSPGYSGSSPGYSSQGYSSPPNQSQQHRYQSFATVKGGNDVKWYVDGCGYFWAISKALDEARESVWILDWWLSPELYLRRPPAQNEQWRLDRVLQRVANRGVKVNVIVYKEVTQALTLFRHPDHLPDSQTTQSSLVSAFQGLKLDAAGLSKLGQDALKGIYGITNDVILYWAHHEKLCLIDGRNAFMGGLDLCFGRWDTNQHSITDVHPENPNLVTFPGQDYNNARVMDFNDVPHPFQNKLDRTKTPRMGWSDISVSLHGPCVDDLRHHFIDRWNFIYSEKYNVRKDARYARLTDPYTHDSSMQVPVPQHLVGVPQDGPTQTTTSSTGQYQQGQQQLSTPGAQPPYGQTFAPPPGSQPYSQPAWQSTARPHTPNTPVSQHSQQQQVPDYSQTQSWETQQYYPPPPPGPPPQGQDPQHLAPQSFPPPDQGQIGSYSPSQQHPSSQTSQSAYTNQQQPISQTGQAAYTSSQQQPSYQTGQTAYTSPQQQPVQQTSQPQYAPYQGSAELPAVQTAQPYQQQVYQNAPGARGLDDGQPYQDHGQAYGSERGFGSRFKGEGKQFEQELSSFGNMLAGGLQQKTGKFFGGKSGHPYSQNYGPMHCQILRSCTLWSNGTPTEKSIQTAYIDVIEKSQHFVYIENQFFITATGDKQKPVQNLIGKALVDRILRAARNNEKYKVIVVIPAVPAFAGDLRDDDSLGTRAIMEFQYFSINRGGHSIMELIAQAGHNPLDYIRFYNLRNYDRINAVGISGQTLHQSGQQHHGTVGASYGNVGGGTGFQPGVPGDQYPQYQTTAQQYSKGISGRWDSVAECYMLGGEDIRNVPWDGPPESELDAFVSEELYIHSKCLIADDRVVICGSANLNDRSQLGTHDSEIAILVDDPTPCQTTMNGRPWQASRFAASLRRQLFRKYLGLLPPQDMTRPNANFEPVGIPNSYDWGSPEDRLVSDPLADTFQALWNTRARTNTDVFRKAFRAVPDDTVHSWNDYKEFYEYYFNGAVSQAEGKKLDPGVKAPSVQYGHVVKEDFPGGVKELKDLLSTVKGTLVEMPLTFLSDEDIAKEGLSLNSLTEQVYT
ncbi:hypothetical protein DV736_g4026, partial [Chaetothyriales sp. CBS 134916]